MNRLISSTWTDFLDLDMNLQRVGTRITFQPYSKLGNAYAYIPLT